MNIDTLIQKWLAGKITKGKAASMTVVGNSLYSYATKIAVMGEAYLTVSTDDCTPTTQKQKIKLVRWARRNGNRILFTNIS